MIGEMVREGTALSYSILRRQRFQRLGVFRRPVKSIQLKNILQFANFGTIPGVSAYGQNPTHLWRDRCGHISEHSYGGLLTELNRPME